MTFDDEPPPHGAAPDGHALLRGTTTSQARLFARLAIRNTTQTTYASNLDNWIKHCNTHNLNPVTEANPDSPEFATSQEAIADYLTERFDDGLSYSGLKNARAAIRAAHVVRGLSSPTDSILATRILQAAKLHGDPAVQAIPATPAVLHCAALVSRIPGVAGERLEHLNDITLLMVAFGLRAYDALSSGSALNRYGLRYTDLRLYTLHHGRLIERQPHHDSRAVAVMMHLRRSKTSTVPATRLVIAAPPGARHAALCPVAATTRILARADAWRRHPGNRLCQTGTRRSGARHLTVNDASALAKASAHIAGVPADNARWSSHSYKRGGTTWYRSAGFSENMIDMLFRWKSNGVHTMLRYYEEPSLEALHSLWQSCARNTLIMWNEEVTLPRAFPS